VRVDPVALRASVAEDDAYYAEVEGVLRATGERFLSVRFERILEGGERGRLLAFLGAGRGDDGVPLRVRSIRQNPGDLRRLVANFAELESSLSGTELAGDLRG
jgi:hypothetical protein